MRRGRRVPPVKGRAVVVRRPEARRARSARAAAFARATAIRSGPAGRSRVPAFDASLLGGAEVGDAAPVNGHGAVHEGPKGRAGLERRGRRDVRCGVGDERFEHGARAFANT